MRNADWKKCVLCGDSRDYLKRIPDNSIDLILTDPPYNIGKHSTGNIFLPGRAPMNNDVAEWDWVDFNPEEWADEFVRILKPTGNLFIFTSYNQIGKWYECLDHKFDASNFMVWHKTNPAPKIFKAGFLNSCELIFTCWNKKHTWNFISQAEMHNFFESAICMRPERLSNPKHPAQKPVALLKKIISIASNSDDIIFDPFMGVGSVGVAALEMGRKYIGIEINSVYFEAARKRINEKMNEITSNNMKQKDVVEEPYNYQTLQSDIFVPTQLSLLLNQDDDIGSLNKQDFKMQPIIKWAGGKEKELQYIKPNLPLNVKRYFEPFVGGGSVYMSMDAPEYYINDLSHELIKLYRCISSCDADFRSYVETINNSWKKAEDFYVTHSELTSLYISYREGNIAKEQLKKSLSEFGLDNRAAIREIVDCNMYRDANNIFEKEFQKNLLRKMLRMKVLEKDKFVLPLEDVRANIETAIKSALYMYYRYLYNDAQIQTQDETLHCALFYFIRNYCYSGMFRYNDKGEFNVPYGGIAYNRKTMGKKMCYFRSNQVLSHFSRTTIDNVDFEEFLRKYEPQEDDFIFLDPPYDSEFSTYALNEFNKSDHQRLANYLINECRAKWMLIIKYTDFIYSLYNKDNINIREFAKEYVVSFMNRNNKKTTHLLITNY